MKSQWSEFMEQLIQDSLSDPDGQSFVEVGRNKDGKPSSISVLPNKACSGWLGSLRDLLASFWLRVLSALRQFTNPPNHR